MYADITDTTGNPIDWTGAVRGAYRAYAAVTDNKNFRGEEMPTFDALPEKIRDAWREATAYAFLAGYAEGYGDGSAQRQAGYPDPSAQA